MWRRQARSCSATRTPRCMPYMYASFHICLIPIPYTSLIYALYISRICVGEGTLDAATIDKELLIDTVSVYTYERARTHAPYMHAGAEPTFSRQEHTLCRVGAPCARLVPQPRESWFCPLTRVRATRNNRFYTCETRRQCPRASRILLKLPRGIAIPIDRHPNPPK